MNTKYYLYLLSVINLLIMHYYILITCRVEEATDATLWIDNLLGVVFDLTIIIALSSLLTLGRMHRSLIITFLISFLWSFSNCLYSRFFHHYISLSSISQVGALTDSFMVANVLSQFNWFDIIFIAIGIAVLYISFFVKSNNNSFSKKHLLITWPCTLLIADLIIHLLFCLSTPKLSSLSYYKHRIIVRHLETLHSSAEPNWAFFHRGTIRQVVFPPLLQSLTTHEITNSQRESIETEYKNHKFRRTFLNNKSNGTNIIFIIVESYLSATSDLLMNGQEVTPFLNSLRHDSTVFFNNYVKPNITLGESSDGQYIYMTGLLPLRSEVTVTKAKYALLPGLPRILKREGIISEAHMIIPTLPSMWEQETMCKKYGFDHLYSSADYQNGEHWYLTDKEIFKYALEKDLKVKKNFLSVVLTMSMHAPYTQPLDSSFIINDPSLPPNYRNYLSTCHYTDKQIKWYIEQLKDKKIYDNSIIIIVADHHAHPEALNMEEKNISIDIPLYIINAHINNKTSWHGHCNQLDIYTTLLDILDVSSTWRGFGHTLITNDYQNSLRPELWQMSEKIILGNYFKNTINYPE